MRSIYDLTTLEAYQLALALQEELPPLDAIEYEDWGRDYVLQRIVTHDKAELDALGICLELPTDS